MFCLRKSFLPLFYFFLISVFFSMVYGMGIGPSSLEIDVPFDGFNSTTVYLTSDGLDGELIIGKENLPFRIEPAKQNMSAGDVNKPVVITVYGNETLSPGVYDGKLTFIGYTGGSMAMGIKIRIRVNLIGEQDDSTSTGLDLYPYMAVGAVLLLSVLVYFGRKRITSQGGHI